MINLSNSISNYIGETFGEGFLDKYKNFTEDRYPSHIRFNVKINEYEALIKQLSNQGIKLKDIDNIENAFQKNLSVRINPFLIWDHFSVRISPFLIPV